MIAFKIVYTATFFLISQTMNGAYNSCSLQLIQTWCQNIIFGYRNDYNPPIDLKWAWVVEIIRSAMIDLSEIWNSAVPTSIQFIHYSNWSLAINEMNRKILSWILNQWRNSHKVSLLNDSKISMQHHFSLQFCYRIHWTRR